MPINLDWRAMRISELMLSARGPASSCSPTGTEPLLQRYPAHSISPIDERWGLKWKNAGDVWEPIPFNTHVVWRHNGPLDPELMQRAINQLAQRHPVLSYSLQYRQGGWRLVRDPLYPTTLCALDRRDREHDESFAFEVMNEFIFREFDFSSQGPFRVGYVTISTDDHLIGFALHHAFSDVYSTRIISFDLAVLYDALINRRDPNLQSLPISFFDYIVSTDQWIRTSRTTSARSYWRQYLNDARALDYARSETLSFSKFSLGTLISARIRKLCDDEKVGVHIFWEAVHHIALSYLLNREDVTTLSVDVGRRHEELVGVVGQFVNLFPSRSIVTGTQTVRTLMQSMWYSYRKSVPHRSILHDVIARDCEFEYEANLGHLNFIPSQFQPLPTFGALVDSRLPPQAKARFVYPYAIFVSDNPQFSGGCGGHIREPFSITDLCSVLERVSGYMAEFPDAQIRTAASRW